MIKFVFAFSLLSSPAFGSPALEREELMAEMRSRAADSDDLSLRILALRAAAQKPDLKQWSQIRELLHHHPGVGWDLIWQWDSVKDKIKTSGKSAVKNMDAKLTLADEAMSTGDDSRASALYRQIARGLQSSGTQFGQRNFFVYQTVLQSLARSLFSQGRYRESLDLYQKISLLYPFVRQVQFEKMWAAFRAGDYSRTLGAIASQLSSYFNSYLEPETYLVQYYLYRRLCRKADVGHVVASINQFKRALDGNQITLDEWARRDLETVILSRLTHADPTAATALVSAADRRREIGKIRAALSQRWLQDLARLKGQVEKVIAYLNLVPTLAKGELPSIPKEDDVRKNLDRESEMWPADDAEDWLDEMGHHLFIGQSECP